MIVNFNEDGENKMRMPILRKICADIDELIDGLSSDELNQLKTDINNATETNCNSVMYDIAQGIRNLVIAK